MASIEIDLSDVEADIEHEDLGWDGIYRERCVTLYVY